MTMNGKYLSQNLILVIAIIKLESFRTFTIVFLFKSELERTTMQLSCQPDKLELPRQPDKLPT